MEQKIRLGVSSCLLGNHVRYDGNNAWDQFITDILGPYVDYIPVCPEVECGLGIPREPLRQVGSPHSPRLVTIQTGRDYTDLMLAWARKRVVELEREHLCGFIFKEKSPSSGMKKVKVYVAKDGIPVKKGTGLFARVFMEHFPQLPVEEEARLHNCSIRENFLERVFTLKRWQDIGTEGENRVRVIDFHSKHKLLLLSHSTRYFKMMSKLVERNENIPLQNFYSEYEKLLMKTLSIKVTPLKNVNTFL